MAVDASKHNVVSTRRGDEVVASLEHRGPDTNGQYRDDRVWLGHTRLSILDLSTAGDQPMRSADGRFIITYNGEVYNYRTLTREHELDQLRSGSDTEVVLELFARLGESSFAHLNGMFAFSVYDSVTGTLWLVRDRLGIKPLYYSLISGRLIFASEVKALLALDPVDHDCDMAGLHEWLYYGTPLAERTLYRGINQLLPGHFLKLDLGSFRKETRAFWTLEEQAATAAGVFGSARELSDEVRRLLEQAVRRQLVSDVPVGVFLSGGIDSTSIVAFASRHAEGRLATYSAGFDFAPGGGELAAARRIAARYGTDHHEVHIAGDGVADLVPKLVAQHDMPFSDAANIPLYLLASHIGGAAKVVLQGDGGDELFGGYSRYTTLSYYRLFHMLARGLQSVWTAAPRSALQYRVRRYQSAYAAADLATTFALLLTTESPAATPASIFGPDIRRAVERSDPFDRFRDCLKMFAGHDISGQMSLVDLMIVLPDTLLEKVDRATMAASLEVRVPFLDNDLVDFAVRLQGRQKTPLGKKKWLLKKALRGIVPSAVLDGPKKGLEVPYGQWLQGPLKSLFFDHLDGFSRSNPDVLNTEQVTRLFERTRSGYRNHSYMLWKVLNLMIWAEKTNIRFQCDPGTDL